MGKRIEIIENGARGMDLIVDRDAGNPVRILTGKSSLQFFQELKKVCDKAIEEIQLMEKIPIYKPK